MAILSCSIQLAAWPKEFLSRMQALLQEEFPEFLSCLEQPYFRGLRWNPLKAPGEPLWDRLPFPVQPSPFSPLGFYFSSGEKRVGRLALHHAGAFYLQEPSASSAVTVLAPQPGERVLDLCAAPGGKSTQIAALLGGKGVIWSNEVVKKRAGILLSNIERMGVANGVVSSCHPETLCSGLAGYFDKVLVDAPCSGEGMFRKEEQARNDWSVEHVQACAARQAVILDSAAQAVREGGVLVYSTCTFSPEENEETVSQFLERHPAYCLEDCAVDFGRPGRLPQTRRIFPMDGGEGHFVAKLRRTAPNEASPPMHVPSRQRKDAQMESLARAMAAEIFKREPTAEIQQVGDAFVLLPEGLPSLQGLGVLRAGILLGEGRPARVEPAHHLFSAARPESLRQVWDLPSGSPEIGAYLRGEEIDIPPSYRGYVGVAADGVMVGFGKAVQGRLKNRYPKGLRNLP